MPDKPQIHQVQDQIERMQRRLGKIHDDAVKQNIYVHITRNPGGGGLDYIPESTNVSWRRVSLVNDSGTSFLPSENPTEFFRNAIEDNTNNTASNISTDILGKDILRTDGDITEANIEQGSHILYYTSVSSPNGTSIPVNLNGTNVSTKISTIYEDSTGIVDRTIYSNLGGAAANAGLVYVPVQANVPTTIVMYFYNGKNPVNEDTRINVKANILDYANTNAAPSPNQPTNLTVSTDKSSAITLQWSFEPLIYYGDQIIIQRGFINEESSDVEKWSTVAIVGGDSIKFTDTSVLQGQRYFYRIRFATTSGAVSPWSDTVEGKAGYSPNTATLLLIENAQTNLSGHYSKVVPIKIVSPESILKPQVVHVDSDGVTRLQTDLTSSDSGKIWKGEMPLSSEWTEGEATVIAKIMGANTTGKDGDPFGANTGGGTVVIEDTYVVDFTEPVFGGIKIARIDDKTTDNFVGSNVVSVFMNKSYDQDIHQVQFSNDANDLSLFSDWVGYNEDVTYSWKLRDNTYLNTIYARIRDKAGNISNIKNDSVKYLHSAPIISSESWTPSDLDLLVWLKADDGPITTGGIAATSGYTVTGWLDKSPNGHYATQPTVSLQPIYSETGFNGKPAVRFAWEPGDQKALQWRPAWSNGLECPTGDWTFGFVFHPINTGGFNQGDYLFASNANLIIAHRYNGGIRDRLGFFDDGGWESAGLGGTSLSGDQFLSFELAEGSGYYVRNGAYLDQDVYQEIDITGRSALGSAHSPGTPYFTGYIAEFFIASGGLTPIERQLMHGYCAHRYDMQSDLPNSHPNKLDTPNKYFSLIWDTGVIPGSIKLLWNKPNSEAIGGYRLYRTTGTLVDTTNDSQIYQTFSNENILEYVDTNVFNGIGYSYAMKLIDKLGFVSTGDSNRISGLTL